MKNLFTFQADEPALILRRIERLGWIILVLLAVPALALVPLHISGGIVLGGVVAIGNFRCVDFYFGRLFQKDKPRPGWWVHVLYAVRFIILMGAVAAAFVWGKMHPVGLVLGLSIPIASITLFGILSLAHRDSAARI